MTTRETTNFRPDGRDGSGLARVVPTGIHGRLDYATDGTNLPFPTLLGAKTLLPSSSGATYNLAMDCEVGVKRILPMRANLALDALKGVLIIASRWLLSRTR
jgi:hypothetical protein